MDFTVVVLGEVSLEARQKMEHLMSSRGFRDFRMIDYNLRSYDVKDTANAAQLDYGIPPSKSYLRWRLTIRMMNRVYYEPPCDLSEVVAVLYEPSLGEDDVPNWGEVARKFRASVYRAEPHGGNIVVELESVAA